MERNAYTDPWQRAGPARRSRPDEPADGQGSILDQPPADDGLRARDDGMRAALHASDVRWKVAAERVIRELAASGQEFTADDVTDRCGRALASSPNAVGALMSSAARRRVIVKVGYRQSRSASRRGGVVAVWRGGGARG